MDVVAIVREALNDAGIKYDFDRIKQRFVIGFDGTQKTPPLMIVIATTSRGCVLSTPFLAGPSTEFNIAIAARVAVLSYELDLPIGVDPEDGEVRAFQHIELAAVEDDLRTPLFKALFKEFLSCVFTAHSELSREKPDASAVKLPKLTELSDIPPCA